MGLGTLGKGQHLEAFSRSKFEGYPIHIGWGLQQLGSGRKKG
jgi:hypothetical protein